MGKKCARQTYPTMDTKHNEGHRWRGMSLSHHPALPLMTGRQATAGKSGTFPQGAWADTQGGEHSLSAEVEEKEQRGTEFPKSLPSALGMASGGHGAVLRHQPVAELHSAIWRISAKGLPGS